jgi:hypothetical protein
MINTKQGEAAPMSSTEAEVRAILEARYPNDRRLQRAMIRLAELDPKGRYGSMTDTADPSFQRIIPQAPGGEATEGLDDTPTAAPTGEPVALKAEPLVMTSTTEAGPKAAKPAGAKAPGQKAD